MYVSMSLAAHVVCKQRHTVFPICPRLLSTLYQCLVCLNPGTVDEDANTYLLKRMKGNSLKWAQESNANDLVYTVIKTAWDLQVRENVASAICSFVFLSLAVQTSMPSFHAKMQSKLRTEAMGADTVVWLAVSAAAIKQPSGLFFQGQKQVTFSS